VPIRSSTQGRGSPLGLGLAPNTLTFHFDRLRAAGLVTARRDGRSMIYFAQYEQMNALLGFLTENCCAGAPAVCAQATGRPTSSKRKTKENE
jgi:ArsR family transcriptional regulator